MRTSEHAQSRTLAVEVVADDYVDVLRRPSGRTALVLIAATLGMAILLASLAGGPVSTLPTRLGEAAEGPSVGAFAAVTGSVLLHVLLCGFAGIFLFGLARHAGRSAAACLAPAGHRAGGLVDGYSAGQMTVTLDGDALRTEMRLERQVRHLGGLGPARVAHGIVRLPTRAGDILFFRAGDAARAWVRALRNAKRGSDPAGWPVPTVDDGWLPFWIPAAEADTAIRRFEAGTGQAHPKAGGTAVILALTLLLLAIGGLHAVRTGDPLVPLALALLVPFAVVAGRDSLQRHLARRGRRPLPGGTEDGVSAGHGAFRADAGAIEIRRRYLRRKIAWAALDNVTEAGEHLLLVAAGRVAEVLPNDPSVHYAMSAGGLRPLASPLAQSQEVRTWHLPSHA